MAQTAALDAAGKRWNCALRSLRMRQAAGLLVADKGSPIEQVAAQAGYSSRSSFSRAFRSVYGCDPAEYRTAAGKAGRNRAPV